MSQKKLEAEIERLETRIHEIDFELMDPDIYAHGEKVKALQTERDTLKQQLGPLETEWMERAG